jgi:hypothetical protein
MSSRSLFAVDETFGLGTIDQVDPFHRSKSVRSGAEAESADPSAMQKVAVTHETEDRKSSTPGVSMLGLGTTDQAAPFHCSIKVTPPTPPPASYPTATQNDVERQETRLSSFIGLGLGEGTIDHGPVTTVRDVAAAAAPPPTSPAAIPTEPATTTSVAVIYPSARFAIATFPPQLRPKV